MCASCNQSSTQRKHDSRFPLLLLQSALRQRQDQTAEDEETARRHLTLQEHLRRHGEDDKNLRIH